MYQVKMAGQTDCIPEYKSQNEKEGFLVMKRIRRGVRRRLAGFLSGLSFKIQPRDPVGQNLLGDRDIEWSWILGNMPNGPGKALELGSGWSLMLSLTASQRGYDVLALDREKYSHPFVAKGITLKQVDILSESLPTDRFDLMIVCSTIEHIGLPNRYGARQFVPEGDLEAMDKLFKATKPGGRLLLTLPVGVDSLFIPKHRIYGEARLPRLLKGWILQKECFWVKRLDDQWESVSRTEALARSGSDHHYGIGCFVLTK
jgi:SAM-dependent methyltransferase